MNNEDKIKNNIGNSVLQAETHRKSELRSSRYRRLLYAIGITYSIGNMFNIFLPPPDDHPIIVILPIVILATVLCLIIVDHVYKTFYGVYLKRCQEKYEN